MKVITVFVFSRLENPPSTLFSSSIEFSTMEVILLYSASIAMSHSGAANCTLYSHLSQRQQERFSEEQLGAPARSAGRNENKTS